MKNNRLAYVVLLGFVMVLLSGMFCFAGAEAEEELNPEEYTVEFGETFSGENEMAAFLADAEILSDTIYIEHVASSGDDFEVLNKEENLYKRWIRWGQVSIVYGPCRANIISEGDEVTELFEVGRFPQNFRNRKCGYMFRVLDEYADEPACEQVTFEWPGAYDYKDSIIFCVEPLSD